MNEIALILNRKIGISDLVPNIIKHIPTPLTDNPTKYELYSLMNHYDNEFLFEYYAKRQDMKRLYFILRNQPKFQRNYLNSFFISSAENNLMEFVKLFLENNVNIHYLDDHALRYAVLRGHYEMVIYLIENGANIHQWEECALFWALTVNDEKMVKLLLHHGALIKDMHPNLEDLKPFLNKNLITLLESYP
jgi:ankyrin repeat protein